MYSTFFTLLFGSAVLLALLAFGSYTIPIRDNALSPQVVESIGSGIETIGDTIANFTDAMDVPSVNTHRLAESLRSTTVAAADAWRTPTGRSLASAALRGMATAIDFKVEMTNAVYNNMSHGLTFLATQFEHVNEVAQASEKKVTKNNKRLSNSTAQVIDTLVSAANGIRDIVAENEL